MKYDLASEQSKNYRLETICLRRLHKDAGACADCHEDAGGHYRCKACAIKESERRRMKRLGMYKPRRKRLSDEELRKHKQRAYIEKYYERVDAGLCWRCKRPLDGESKQLCAACFDRQREYKRAYYREHKWQWREYRGKET